MEQFTLKDLIKLNQTCFVCQGESVSNTVILDQAGSENVPLACLLIGDLLQINIKNLYREGPYKLLIDISTHQFSFISPQARDYVTGDLFLALKCNGCNSQTHTNNFEFNENGLISPISLDHQIVFIKDDSYIYQINTSFNPEINKSRIVIDSLVKTTPLSPTVINVPAFSMYDFKNIKELIKKIKLYLVLL